MAAFEYNANNKLVKVDLNRIDPIAETDTHEITLYEYDGRNLVTKEINALGDGTVYTYDGVGNLVSKADADGYVTEYTYNALDLVSHINYNEGKQADFAYNKVGQLVQMDDWTGTNTFELDLLGQLKKATDHKGNVVEYTYDKVGNETSIAEYTFDETNRMVMGTNKEGEASLYTFNALGVRVGTELIIQDNTHGYTDFHCETPSVEVPATGPHGPEVVKTDYIIDYNRFYVDQRVLMKHEIGGYDFRYTYGIDKLQAMVTSEGSDWWGQVVHKCEDMNYVHTDRLGTFSVSKG